MPKNKNDAGKDWQHTDNQGARLSGNDGAYEQQEWGKNCVMFALSKVMAESTGTLAARIVDGHVGGVTMIKQMENSSIIKKVLAELGFKPVKEGGAKWKDMKVLLKSRAPRRFYATYWRNKQQEDWSDKEVQPGKSDHAFAVIAYKGCIVLPATNDVDFDKGHPADDEFVSVWEPSAGVGVEPDRGIGLPPAGAQKIAY